ncbi:Replication factor A protein 1 [Castilleja foliolosa]|uniref:Replication factor A protein 1 n=1 Tax=Castilleja foliolosa TaxID=1961234 RepID=A0ABD3CBM1_9LAMI
MDIKRQKGRDMLSGDSIEATAEVKRGEHFDSVIQVHSCYKVSGYICVGPKTYMATVNHPASLIIGLKARFELITNSNIPNVYFNFSSYDVLKTRIRDAKILTDYIGRVERNASRSTSTGKVLQKILLQDERERKVEITLWPEMRHLIGDDVIPGDIVAITSTMVTDHNGLLQLELTYLTTTTINPDLPQTIEHVNRLRALPIADITTEKIITLHDLSLKNPQNIQSYTNFICEAKIKHIHDDRGWYYALCSKCSNKLYPEQEGGVLNFVCKDDDDVIPNFRYCVKATITDATGTADVVFFNESMYAMLNISCEDMVTKHAHATNPKKLPHLIASITNTPRLLHITVKNDGKIVVNNVTEVTPTCDTQSTSTFTPATPSAKQTTSKRQYPAATELGEDWKMKRA